MKKYLIVFIAVIIMAGCSDFKSPTENLTLESVVSGGASLNKGMTKNEIMEKWGRPDEIKIIDQSKWGASIERWTYRAWIPDFPIDYRYVSKSRHLYFEGDALVKWEEIESKQGDHLKREVKRNKKAKS